RGADGSDDDRTAHESQLIPGVGVRSELRRSRQLQAKALVRDYISSRSAPMSLPVPSRYVGSERIYRGGTADVYSALDRELGRKVAIKILSDSSAGDEDARAWLRREAMAVARLSHVLEVVRVYDVGSWHGRPYMAMEFLGGGSVAQRLQRGPITGDLAMRWLWQAAVALDAAHEVGIVHRDVTPHNLLLDVR